MKVTLVPERRRTAQLLCRLIRELNACPRANSGAPAPERIEPSQPMHPYFGSGITIAPSGPAYGLDEPAENRVSKSIQAGLHEGLVIDSTVRVQIIFNLIPLRSKMRSFRTIIFLLLVSSTAIAAADNPELSSLGLSSPSVKSGNSLRGTVTLNMAAPFDIEVSLAGDPPGAAKLPGSVIVPAGSNSANFTISLGIP